MGKGERIIGVIIGGLASLIIVLLPFMFAKLVLSHSPKPRPGPFVSTAQYQSLCDTALGEIRWVAGVPICLVNLGKYDPNWEREK